MQGIIFAAAVTAVQLLPFANAQASADGAGRNAPVAAALAAQEATTSDAQDFLKEMLLAREIGTPQSGTWSIAQVVFTEDCMMGLRDQDRLVAAVVDFRKANFKTLHYNIAIMRGVSVVRAGRLVQPQNSSSVTIAFFPEETPRVMAAFSVLHDQCYVGSSSPF